MKQFLMWMKSKHILNSHIQASMNSFSNSWEEQAFAEDSRGPLGGFIWPPRSYSCSFCQREFRSAQALGGHMNVHRRDRARLKQCLISPQSHEDLSKPLETHFPSQICASDSNPSFVTSKNSSPILLGHEDYNVETNLSMGLNLAAPNGANGDEAISPKRRKTAVLPLQFIHKPCSDDRYTNFQSEILGLKSSPMEDIDLELRLGDSSKVE